jgi:hypothetical protein
VISLLRVWFSIFEEGGEEEEKRIFFIYLSGVVPLYFSNALGTFSANTRKVFSLGE